ncbi:uncharacterized protein LOC110832244 [Zootermopsis nevadensis]|uniref:uncharacterized protein LOC110832244 n=1 Tax=Zootermopsis nevadensis TaxID=136037 RepID=UPI000B8E4461|nr:uncharacterized protein LOC110832244 [Zootermopsis nevadensis]
MTKAETIFAFYLVIIGAKALNLRDRKYDIPVLDPLVVQNLFLTHSGINVSSSNFTIAGVKDAVIEDFSIDFEKQIIRVSFLIPHAVLNGDYSIAGTLVGLPIYGKGLYETSFG